MKRHVMFIHGAGSRGSSSDLQFYLEKELSEDYRFIAPEMPEAQQPTYKAWKSKLEKEIKKLDTEVILIGHSLGGSVIMKYLSEKPVVQEVIAVFILAAPFWGRDDEWRNNDFTIQEAFLSQIPITFLYYSTGDEIVPLNHQQHYNEAFPSIKTRILNNYDHFFKNKVPELIKDIKEYGK